MTSMKKDATKFIVRYEEANDPLHQAVKEAAKAEHMSVNSFILRAIDRDINRGKAMDRLLDLAEQRLT